MENFIGVDVGGTNIRVGLLNKDLELIEKKVFLTHDFSSIAELCTQINEAISEIDPHHVAKKIGFALPIPWNEELEILRDATNILYLEGVERFKIKSYFPNHTVYFENDVNAIALLEAKHGAAKAHRNALFVTVSTGIASGLIINSQIYQGTHGYAGEVGSIIIQDGGSNLNTLEELCSGTYLKSTAEKIYGNAATAGDLFENYLIRDSVAIKEIDVWFDRMSSALASMIHMFDPGVIVLGGAVIQNNLWVIEKIYCMTKGKLFDNLQNKLKIVPPHFGGNAGIIGAGILTIAE